jgi:hypothetical protein
MLTTRVLKQLFSSTGRVKRCRVPPLAADFIPPARFGLAHLPLLHLSLRVWQSADPDAVLVSDQNPGAVVENLEAFVGIEVARVLLPGWREEFLGAVE